MDFYWVIEQYDGTLTHIPPASVEDVRRKRKENLPIQTSAGDITPSQIKSFRISDKRFHSQPLLEAAAAAFNEPILSEEGAVMCKWVKKSVSQQSYQKHYAGIPAYKRLDEQNGMVIVAFRLPIHQITHELDVCNGNEVLRLTKSS